MQDAPHAHTVQDGSCMYSDKCVDRHPFGVLLDPPFLSDSTTTRAYKLKTRIINNSLSSLQNTRSHLTLLSSVPSVRSV
ncbi:hypothetical protein IE53DRAFT_389936 [Violaceomyces palustris]|uniref:Uncharacterized protein n=1 Tax=Violaceomyces palustris TaxID=1673888 RepID=A0ACD0NQ31_9BASI|nr:hypothetical protein IE53DRAFT_389936 [Violaceomyces palustris]